MRRHWTSCQRRSRSTTGRRRSTSSRPTRHTFVLSSLRRGVRHRRRRRRRRRRRDVDVWKVRESLDVVVAVDDDVVDVVEAEEEGETELCDVLEAVATAMAAKGAVSARHRRENVYLDDDGDGGGGCCGGVLAEAADVAAFEGLEVCEVLVTPGTHCCRRQGWHEVDGGVEAEGRSVEDAL